MVAPARGKSPNFRSADRYKKPPRTVKIALPRLRPDQSEILLDPAKIKVLAAGRRWGKTVLGAVAAVIEGMAGNAVAWIVPSYKLGRPLWRQVEAAVRPMAHWGVTINRAERTVEFPTGGRLGIYSGDSDDCGIRGEAFHGVIIDEAAMMPEIAWTDAIQPTLADHDGWAILISTPKGHNWFHREYLRGRSDGEVWKSWNAPTSANPSPQIRKAAEQARERMPDRTYRQEWLAQFVEASGIVFRNISACLYHKNLEETAADHENHRIVLGVDWAQTIDYTAFSVYCSDCRREVELDRFNSVAWSVQQARLQRLFEKWKAKDVLAELNSIGSPNVEALRKEGLPVIGFQTSPQSKPQLIQDLVLAFEREQAKWIDDPQATAELESYEAVINRTNGYITYSAPKGAHDDTVMARALAFRAAKMSFKLEMI
jgi:hypothetical protein